MTQKPAPTAIEANGPHGHAQRDDIAEDEQPELLLCRGGELGQFIVRFIDESSTGERPVRRQLRFLFNRCAIGITTGPGGGARRRNGLSVLFLAMFA